MTERDLPRGIGCEGRESSAETFTNCFPDVGLPWAEAQLLCPTVNQMWEAHHLARKLGRAREEKLTRTEVTTIVDSHEWSRDTCSQVSCLLPPGLLCRCGLRAAEEGSPPPHPAPLPQSGESGLAPLEQLWPFKQPSPDTSSRQQPSLPWVPCQRASLVAQLVKNPSVMQETPVGFPGQEDAPWRRDSRPKARLLARLLKCRDQILFTLFPLSALRILPWTK